jgi:hypothetical protein
MSDVVGLETAVRKYIVIRNDGKIMARLLANMNNKESKTDFSLKEKKEEI